MSRLSFIATLSMFGLLCIWACSPSETETGFIPDGCVDSEDCMQGETCSDGTCVSMGTGGAGGTGGTGGTGGSPGDGCEAGEKGAEGEFALTPTRGTSAPPYVIRKTVCFHGTHTELDCPIFNYRIPPDPEFSEFVDIFYDGEACDQFLAEFDDAKGRYIFSGIPTRVPPQSPDPAPALVATGTYFILSEAEGGDFEYYWPAP